MTLCLMLDMSETASASDRMTAIDVNGPQISVLDLGVTRGDGIFEVLAVVDGHPQAVAAHLRRLQNSAAMLELPRPDLGLLEQAVRRVAAEQYQMTHERELLIKIVMTRGVEDAMPAAPTCWVVAFPSADFSRERSEGIDIITLDRGYPHDIAARAPWLLAGAKTLSYAVNKAAGREAARRGADDALLISSDGFALEGPTSSLIVRIGARIWTPSSALGVLAGTTQGSAFAFFAEHGYATAQALLRMDDVYRADAMWFVSSGRMAAPVRSLDGRSVPVDHGLTDALNESLLGRIE